MYSLREETARAARAAKHKKLEKERWDFVRKIRKEQRVKRQNSAPDLAHEP